MIILAMDSSRLIFKFKRRSLNSQPSVENPRSQLAEFGQIANRWRATLGRLFGQGLIKLKKQSPSVANLDSKAKTAFLNGFKTNERIRKSEKKFRVWITRLTLSFNKLLSLVIICSSTGSNLITESTDSLAVIHRVLQYNLMPPP
ncbi:hypothetical protein RclHR1_11590006 [Rhizophagus clarus]|uniref:Uncharacterized protein n=1 Tax=Rhizophagus clarus TaxID=94130 RepID=A0A2Z6Q925_9GLOM|nr:hypothetical protein RclHR1_11590006 [Rhizophagus clarus]